MKKWYIILIIMLVLPTVMSVNQLQISEDNTSWQNATSIFYGGSIDDSLQKGTAQNLEFGTIYYARVRIPAVTNWAYIRFKTDGVEDKMIALALVMIIISGFYFAVAHYNKMIYLKFAGLIFGVLELMLLFFVVFADYLGNNVENLLRINSIVLIFSMGPFLFLLFTLIIIRMMNPGAEEEGVDPKWVSSGKNQ